MTNDKLFYPPLPNSFLINFAQFITPVATRYIFQFELHVDRESIETIQKLSDRRLLLLPNHPTFQDPIVMFALSGKLKQQFYYLSAYELFQGVMTGIFQRLGVYSIRRGLVDRPSIAQTIEILTRQNSHLVVFPEGGCSFQNDTVMPFRAGAIQIAFQAMSKLAKQGEITDLYALPISIKYRYTKDMQGVIHQTLNRLERALRIKSNGSDYDRLRAIAQQVLVQMEREYDTYSPTKDELSWDERISLLRTHILEHCEQQLGISSNPKEALRERTYKIEDVLKTQADALELETLPEAETSTGDRANKYTLIEKSIKRLLNFDAIYDGYVAEKPTPERFLDTLTRLEREVFDIDKPPAKGYRQARIKVGEPINLQDFFTEYQRDRASIINAVTLKVQQTVQQNLNLLNGNE
jgi:1-acyl-sn-glycerol-3-phosphate acyltransferase